MQVRRLPLPFPPRPLDLAAACGCAVARFALESRWRTVMTCRTIPVARLDALPGHALELSSEWMEEKGGMELGYEQLRKVSEHESDADAHHVTTA